MSIYESTRKMTVQEQEAYDKGYRMGKLDAIVYLYTIVYGEWIDPEYDDGGTTWHCSRCSQPVKAICGKPGVNFCSNCGAYMRG